MALSCLATPSIRRCATRKALTRWTVIARRSLVPLMAKVEGFSLKNLKFRGKPINLYGLGQSRDQMDGRLGVHVHFCHCEVEEVAPSLGPIISSRVPAANYLIKILKSLHFSDPNFASLFVFCRIVSWPFSQFVRIWEWPNWTRMNWCRHFRSSFDQS